MNIRVELFVACLKSSVEFYRDVLAFQVPGELDSSYISVRKGNAVLGLSEMKNLPDHHPLKATADQRPGLGVELVLEADDVEQVYDQVKAKAYPIHMELADRPWGLKDFRVVDPDGYYVRITSSK
ncbi:VOC family protein [Virgibacillus xinjiangensis]|uniref:VOC family protein n=1 Tax=Virgibacillus xinjiangensis TaxID=393090 RepID=A0ABV7CWJ4_9BACI